MKIVIDRGRCEGHARCHAESPSLFALDEEGYAWVTSSDVPRELEAAARRAAMSCPERAIELDARSH